MSKKSVKKITKFQWRSEDYFSDLLIVIMRMLEEVDSRHGDFPKEVTLPGYYFEDLWLWARCKENLHKRGRGKEFDELYAEVFESIRRRRKKREKLVTKLR